MEEMANEFNRYFIGSISKMATGSSENDLSIGNEHPICALDQFNKIYRQLKKR